jgi:hypothetical protein
MFAIKEFFAAMKVVFAPCRSVMVMMAGAGRYSLQVNTFGSSCRENDQRSLCPQTAKEVQFLEV